MKLVQVFMDIFVVSFFTMIGWWMIKDELLEIIDTLSDINRYKGQKKYNLNMFNLVQSILYVIAFFLFYSFLCILAIGGIELMFSYEGLI